MQRKHNRVLSRLTALVCALCLCLLSLPAFAEGESGRRITVSTAQTVRQGSGSYCTVSVDSLGTLASLELTVHFDPAAVQVSEGNLYNEATACRLYDSHVTDGEIRLTYLFDGNGAEGAQNLCSFFYSVPADAPVGMTGFDVTVGEALDGSLNALPVSGSRCSFAVEAYVAPDVTYLYDYGAVNTSVRQEFTLRYELADANVVSGSAVLGYDPELFEPVTVTRGGLLEGKLTDINQSLAGSVYLSFAGTACNGSRDLLSVTFRTRRNLAETADLTMTVKELFRLNGAAVTCPPLTTRVTVAHDPDYAEDAPAMQLHAAYSEADRQLTARIALDAESHLGAGDFVLRFDPERLVFLRAGQKLKADFLIINDKNAAAGEVKFSVLSTSDIVTAGDVLEVVFSVPHACETLPAIPLTLEGKNLSDSITHPILLNFIGTEAKLTGHTPGAPVTDQNGDYRYTPCTECGAETAREWLCEEALAFAAHFCSFHNNLTLNYYLDASVAAQYGNLRLVLEQDVWSRDGTKTVAHTELTGVPVERGGVQYLKFSFSGIAAAQLSSDIRARLYAEKDGAECHGRLDTYNLKTYAYNRLEASEDTAFRTLMVNLLNYCTAAQVYFGIRTDAPVNAELTGEQRAQASGTPTVSGIAGLTEQDGAAAEFVGHSVLFNSNVVLKSYFRLDGVEDKSNVTLRVKVADADGSTTVYTLPFDAFGYDPETGRYNAKLDTLAAPQFRSRLELTVMNGETAISGTYTYSIETYVANRLSGSTDGNFRALLVAMMRYSDAARAYLGKGN